MLSKSSKSGIFLLRLVAGWTILATLLFMLSACSSTTREESRLVSNDVDTEMKTCLSDNILVKLCSDLEDTEFDDAGPAIITAYSSAEGYTVLWGDEKSCFMSILTDGYDVTKTYPLSSVVTGTAVWTFESGEDRIIFSSTELPKVSAGPPSSLKRFSL